jgi:RNA polymerase sigma-70 factor (ECF subfamily)
MSMALQRPRLGEAAGEPTKGSPEPAQPIGIEELFRRHAPAVASLGLSMLQSVEEADDLVQDVFVRAWRAIDRLEDREAARPWLMTIAIRLARTRLRRRKLTRLLFRTEEPEFDQIASAVVLPEHRDMVKRLYTVLEKLPVDLRMAWVLRHIQEETVQSVADLCGWSLSTAKRRLQAAEARVGAKLNAVPPLGRSQP